MDFLLRLFAFPERYVPAKSEKSPNFLTFDFLLDEKVQSFRTFSRVKKSEKKSQITIKTWLSQWFRDGFELSQFEFSILLCSN